MSTFFSNYSIVEATNSERSAEALRVVTHGKGLDFLAPSTNAHAAHE